MCFVFFMARPVHTKPSGKGKLPNGKKHLNASLPQQLVFDFNAFAKRQGHGRRDAIVEDILRRFLERVEPDAPSLRQHPSSPFVKHVVANLTARDTKSLARNAEEQAAIRVARELAAEILTATSTFVTRKPPRHAAKQQVRKRRAS